MTGEKTKSTFETEENEKHCPNIDIHIKPLTLIVHWNMICEIFCPSVSDSQIIRVSELWVMYLNNEMLFFMMITLISRYYLTAHEMNWMKVGVTGIREGDEALNFLHIG